MFCKKNFVKKNFHVGQISVRKICTSEKIF